MFDCDPRIEDMAVAEMLDLWDYMDFCEELEAEEAENGDECGY